MIEKIKSWAKYILGALVVILGGILFNRNRKLQQTESELAKSVSDKEIALNDQAREAARANADALVDEYHKLRGDD